VIHAPVVIANDWGVSLMRTHTIAFLVVSTGLFVTPAWAKSSTDAAKPPSCTAQWQAMSDADKKATTRKAFMAGCKTSAAPAAAPMAATPAATSGPQGRMATCAAGWNAMSADQKKATTYKDYSKSCLAGGSKAVAATPAMAPTTMKPAKPMAASTKPMAPSSTMGAAGGPAPAGATGQCKDGTFTMSKTHSGSCSHHGGVAKWF
jgi:uncharacterized protein DUF3761